MLVNVCACRVVYLLLFVVQFLIACLEGNKIETERGMDRQAEKQMHRQTSRHRERGGQTGRQTDA